MTANQKSPIDNVETSEQKRLNDARETPCPVEEMGTVS